MPDEWPTVLAHNITCALAGRYALRKYFDIRDNLRNFDRMRT